MRTVRIPFQMCRYSQQVIRNYHATIEELT